MPSRRSTRKYKSSQKKRSSAKSASTSGHRKERVATKTQTSNTSTGSAPARKSLSESSSSSASDARKKKIGTTSGGAVAGANASTSASARASPNTSARASPSAGAGATASSVTNVDNKGSHSPKAVTPAHRNTPIKPSPVKNLKGREKRVSTGSQKNNNKVHSKEDPDYKVATITPAHRSQTPDDYFHEEPVEILRTPKQPDPFNPCWLCRSKMSLRSWCRCLAGIELVLFAAGIGLFFWQPTLFYDEMYIEKEDRLMAITVFLTGTSAFFIGSVFLLVASVGNRPACCIVTGVLMGTTVVFGLTYIILSSSSSGTTRYSPATHSIFYIYILINFFAGLCAIGLYCQFKAGLYDTKFQMDADYVVFFADDYADSERNSKTTV